MPKIGSHWGRESAAGSAALLDTLPLDASLARRLPQPSAMALKASRMLPQPPRRIEVEDAACAVFAFENVVKPFVLRAGEPDPAALEKGAEAFHRVAAVLDGHLVGKEFVTGDRLTVADFSLGAAMNVAEIGRYPIEPYRQIRRWYARLAALPAWQTTLAQCALPSATAA